MTDRITAPRLRPCSVNSGRARRSTRGRPVPPTAAARSSDHEADPDSQPSGDGPRDAGPVACSLDPDDRGRRAESAVALAGVD